MGVKLIPYSLLLIPYMYSNWPNADSLNAESTNVDLPNAFSPNTNSLNVDLANAVSLNTESPNANSLNAD